MGRVDQRIDTLVRQIVGEPFGAAETADAHRHRLRGGRRGAARQRQRHGKLGAPGQPFRQPARFRRAAENEDTHGAC